MYIVLELFPEPRVVTDEEGKVKYFDWMDEAFQEAKNCQDGLVINIASRVTC